MNSDTSSDEAVFVDAEQPETEPKHEATRPLTPEQYTEETRPLEELKPEDDRSLRLQLEEQDKDIVSLAPKTEETESAGPLTQLFAAYGFNPFEPRPDE